MYSRENQIVVGTETHEIRIDIEKNVVSVKRQNGGIIANHEIESLEPDT